MKPVVNTYKLTKEEIDSLQVPSGSNLVLVHIPHQNKDTATESGIIVVADQDFKPALHAERWGYIYNLPPDLVYEEGNVNTMPWKTSIECSVGDKVWFEARAALYAYTIECDNEWYKILPYSCLYVSKNKEKEATPLNGYVLFEEFVPEVKSAIVYEAKKDDLYGIVAISGEPNELYMLDFWNDGIHIEDGDHVLFEKGTSCFPLESELHREFSDNKYVVQQRKTILAVVDESHSSIIRLNKGVVGVEMVEDKKEVGDIVLTKSIKNNRVGFVKHSNNDSIPVGSVLLLPKKKGAEFNGLEYYTEDRILYYETA
jgi:hypothetical protein